MEEIINWVRDFDARHGLVNDGSDGNTVFLAFALVGEVGELINVIKKHVRGDDIPNWKELCAEELVDVVIYVAELISSLGIDFPVAFELKKAALERKWANRREGRMTVDCDSLRRG